jgi:hypothetical protein
VKLQPQKMSDARSVSDESATARVVAALRQAWRQLTIVGRVLVIGGVISTVLAFAIGQLVLVRVGVLLILLPPVCLAIMRRNRPEVVATRRLEPARLQVGEEATVTVGVRNVANRSCGLLLAGDELPIGLLGESRFVVRGLAPGATTEASYRVTGLVRGRHPIGPMGLRLADPFGMCEVDRHVSGSDLLVVIPAVHPLPEVRIGAEASGSGEGNSALPSSGEDDIGVREYRHGDSLRRVNWRVTARRGELMVRQEEHPEFTRGTILLDTRSGAHRGQGLDSSLEWAISAVASIGIHLLSRRFCLHMLTEAGSGMGGLLPEVLAPGPGADGLFLDALAGLQPTAAATVPAHSHNAAAGDGVLVAVLGSMAPAEAAEVAARRRSGMIALAIVLATDTWGGKSRGKGHDAQATLTVLRSRGWSAVIAKSGDAVPELWQRMLLGSGVPRVQSDSDSAGAGAA